MTMTLPGSAVIIIGLLNPRLVPMMPDVVRGRGRSTCCSLFVDRLAEAGRRDFVGQALVREHRPCGAAEVEFVHILVRRGLPLFDANANVTVRSRRQPCLRRGGRAGSTLTLGLPAPAVNRWRRRWLLACCQQSEPGVDESSMTTTI